MTTQTTGEDVAKYATEAAALRMKLEALANKGLFDLSKKEIRDAHERLDKLEAFIYKARRVV